MRKHSTPRKAHQPEEPERPAFFAIPYFDQVQYRRDRELPWIKLEVQLLDNPEHLTFQMLPDAVKWQFCGLLLLARRFGNRLPFNVAYITRAISASEPVNLDLLLEVGLIIPANSLSAKAEPPAPAGNELGEDRRTSDAQMPSGGHTSDAQMPSDGRTSDAQMPSDGRTSDAQMPSGGRTSDAQVPSSGRTSDAPRREIGEERVENRESLSPYPLSQNGNPADAGERERKKNSGKKTTPESRHPLDTRRRYAEWQKRMGQPIKSPAAVARTTYADGSEDEAIDAWLIEDTRRQTEIERAREQQQAREREDAIEHVRLLLKDGGPQAAWEKDFILATLARGWIELTPEARARVESAAFPTEEVNR